eukprot:4026810-Prymnesium_polylepis.2
MGHLRSSVRQEVAVVARVMRCVQRTDHIAEQDGEEHVARHDEKCDAKEDDAIVSKRRERRRDDREARIVERRDGVEGSESDGAALKRPRFVAGSEVTTHASLARRLDGKAHGEKHEAEGIDEHVIRRDNL